MNLAKIRKLIAYVVGVLAEVVALGVLPEKILPYATGIIAVATGLGIYQAENETNGA
jgi:hypothetical protein